MTHSKRDEIAAAYEPGVTSLRALADRFGTNHHVVRRALQDAGIPIVKAKKRPVSAESRRRMSEAKKGFRPAWLGKPVSRGQLYANMKSHLRFDVSIEWLSQFSDFEKLKMLNMAISHSERFPRETDWYHRYVEHFYYDQQFNYVYLAWIISDKDPWKRPSIDHIHPSSQGGLGDLENLQFLSWFENRCKNHLSQEVWSDLKSRIWEYLLPIKTLSNG